MINGQQSQARDEHVSSSPDDVRGPAHVTVPTRRESMYMQHFVTKVSETSGPVGFFQQVDGFGARVFAQMSSFGTR